MGLQPNLRHLSLSSCPQAVSERRGVEEGRVEKAGNSDPATPEFCFQLCHLLVRPPIHPLTCPFATNRPLSFFLFFSPFYSESCG